MKDKVAKHLSDWSTSGNEEIKTIHNTSESNNNKDRIQLDIKRNTKETIVNNKTNDDNNFDAVTGVISDLINYHTNQNSNDNYDSDNELLLTYNNGINICNFHKDTNTQNKGKHIKQSIEYDDNNIDAKADAVSDLINCQTNKNNDKKYEKVIKKFDCTALINE